MLHHRVGRGNMKNKNNRDLVHTYFIKLYHYSSKAAKDYNEETIHLFRLNVKKLRAFLRMLRGSDMNSPFLRFPHRFKKMYSLTGKIRDRQLCLKKIKQFAPLQVRLMPEKVNSLKQELREFKKNKDHFFSKQEYTEMENNLMPLIPALSIRGAPKDFFSANLKMAASIIDKGVYTNTELHTVRKQMKDIVYVIRIYRKDLATSLPFIFWDDPQLKKIEKILHLLGLFNDLCIALALIKQVNGHSSADTEKQALYRLRHAWLLEKRVLKKDILPQLPLLKYSIENSHSQSRLS